MHFFRNLWAWGMLPLVNRRNEAGRDLEGTQELFVFCLRGVNKREVLTRLTERDALYPSREKEGM